VIRSSRRSPRIARRPLRTSRATALLLGLTLGLGSATSEAQIVVAEPAAPLSPPFPEGAPPVEAQVVLQLVVDADGHVESAIVASRLPADASPLLDRAALDAVTAATFHPSTRDGRPVRARVEYVVVFRPPPVAATATDAGAPANSAGTAPATAPAPVASSEPAPAPPAPAPSPPPSPPAAGVPTAPKPPTGPVSTNEQDEDYAQVVQVRGAGWASPRGIDDVRIKRDLLEASPRQQTSEMLSAAPGFFVDHEDGEGLGNDVYLRGFDLEHGAGIEMRVGNVPINSPVHVAGQGYADANFILPEVVRSIRVLGGPYDPRQGDTAIVGSAYLDLGVPERGYQLKTTSGAFNQARVVGIVAPEGADEETFAAFSLRHSDGFGESRATQSGSMNAQYSFDAGARDHIRLLGTAYAARSSMPGVLRLSDVDSGAIGYYDQYPQFAEDQGVQSSRVILGADFDHVAANGARFEFAPWVMWTDFRSRQNFSGNIDSSQLDPEVAGGLGDLWEAYNQESALGMTARFRAAPSQVGSWLEVTPEPGVFLRAGHTDQTKSLLDPSTLQPWDRRLDAGLTTLDAAAYLDVDLRFWKRLRIAGGVRADLLQVSVDDRLKYDVPASQASSAIPGAIRGTQGVSIGPRVTAEYDITREIAPVVSYGEGFRSLDATANVATSAATAGAGPSIQEGSMPYSKVRAGEAGVRAQTVDQRYTATVAFFETWIANELVSEPTSGGFTTEGPSLRRGVLGSAVVKPFEWLLASVAATVTSGTFSTLVVGVIHYIPQVPPVVVRVDVTARGKLATIADRPLTGRVGIGYTYLAPRYLTEVNSAIRGPSNNVLNANGALRYANVELGVDAFNVLGLRYADDEEWYTSNWSVTPGPHLASSAVHILSAAPPLEVLGTLALYF
jgi:TonB family protein